MSNVNLTRGRLGYSIQHENRNELVNNGVEPQAMMRQFKEQLTPNNPTAFPSIIPILDQGQQGSCQGNALAKMFQICYFLQTGRMLEFSRACGYYLAQRKDGLRGDVGSTLSGGLHVATVHGMCLEEAWPYPGDRYNPSQPAGLNYPFKLAVSKPITNIDTALEWLDLGLPIQTGIIWDSSCDQEIVDDYRGRSGGGHSTALWSRTESGNCRNINSWSRNWCHDGIQEWTVPSFDRMLRNPQNVFIGYAPENMLYPDPRPI